MILENDRQLDGHLLGIPHRIGLGFVATALCMAFILLSSPAALSAGEPTEGQKIFVRCAGCHSTVAGETKVGPSLAGVFGRKSGTETGFNYSPAIKSANITWDKNSLDKYLTNPAAMVHGTRMFINVPSAEDRQNLISYLESLSK